MRHAGRVQPVNIASIVEPGLIPVTANPAQSVLVAIISLVVEACPLVPARHVMCARTTSTKQCLAVIGRTGNAASVLSFLLVRLVSIVPTAVSVLKGNAGFAANVRRAPSGRAAVAINQARVPHVASVPRANSALAALMANLASAGTVQIAQTDPTVLAARDKRRGTVSHARSAESMSMKVACVLALACSSTIDNASLATL